MQKIYVVFEIEWPSRHIKGPPHGYFSNFAAADKYVRECYTFSYDRHMMILATHLHQEWPYKYNPNDINELTYYHQVNGQMIGE